jgi:hypothetical protein
VSDRARVVRLELRPPETVALLVALAIADGETPFVADVAAYRAALGSARGKILDAMRESGLSPR